MTASRIYRPLVQSALIAMAAVGCAEYPPMTPQVTGLQSHIPLMSASGRQPTLFKNVAKYSEGVSELAIASARSGNVTLSARALIGSDGTVTLIISTGNIDSDVAPGILDHVQIKLADPQGNEKRTLNYEDFEGGRAEIHLPTGFRGGVIQILANVKGISYATEVVTVSTAMYLRPDLMVGSINAPAEVLVNTPVSVSATVTEKNGDYGARGDCVLLEDGAEISRASGIWVEAGRSVTCAFLPTFRTVGDKLLTVTVVNVSPEEWDSPTSGMAVRVGDSNNSLSTTIKVLDPRPLNEFNWQGRVNGRADIRGIERSEGFWELPTYEQRSDWSYFKEYLGEGWRDANVDGRRGGALNGPLTATYKDRIDQTVLNDGAFDPTVDTRRTFEGDQRHATFGMVHVKQACSFLTRTVNVTGQYGPTTATVAHMTVCSNIYSGPPGAETLSETFFMYGSHGGDVTYYANDYSVYVAPGYKDAYSFNGNITYSFGAFTLGSEYSFEITVTGADGSSLTASGSIPLTSQPITEVVPFQCTEYRSDTYNERSCTETNLSYTRFGGNATGKAAIQP